VVGLLCAAAVVCLTVGTEFKWFATAQLAAQVKKQGKLVSGPAVKIRSELSICFAGDRTIC
jgi:hypothetical protein